MPQEKNGFSCVMELKCAQHYFLLGVYFSLCRNPCNTCSLGTTVLHIEADIKLKFWKPHCKPLWGSLLVCIPVWSSFESVNQELDPVGNNLKFIRCIAGIRAAAEVQRRPVG